MELEVIPSSWYIYVTTKEQYLEVLSYFQANSSKKVNPFHFEYPYKDLYMFFSKDNWGYNGRLVHSYGENEITWEQFKKLSMKKLIGYRLKVEAEKYRVAAGILAAYDLPLNEAHIYEGTGMYNNLLRAGVLEDWFEPVYETKPEFQEVSLGNPERLFRVFKDHIEVVGGDGQTYHISNTVLEGVDSIFRAALGIVVGYAIYPTSLQIGCGDGVEVTLKVFKQIKDIQNEL